MTGRRVAPGLQLALWVQIVLMFAAPCASQVSSNPATTAQTSDPEVSTSTSPSIYTTPEPQVSSSNATSGTEEYSWGRAEFAHCRLDKEWQELHQDKHAGRVVFEVGGLGRLMERGKFEVWMCVKDHECSPSREDPYFCFVYDEREEQKTFVPWNSAYELALLEEQPVSCQSHSDCATVQFCASSGQCEACPQQGGCAGDAQCESGCSVLVTTTTPAPCDCNNGEYCDLHPNQRESCQPCPATENECQSNPGTEGKVECKCVCFGTCHECQSGGDCPSNEFCDLNQNPTEVHQCVECPADGNPNSCNPLAQGSEGKADCKCRCFNDCA